MRRILGRAIRRFPFLVPRPPRFEIQVVGTLPAGWAKTLQPGAPVWAGVKEVAPPRPGRTPHPPRLQQIWRRLVLPLKERDFDKCPTGWALLPSPEALAILSDKARFADYMASPNLMRLVPPRFATIETADFPCVLKRTDLTGGDGIALVGGRDDYERLRRTRPWLGHQEVLQAFVPGTTEFVTHCVAVDGRIVWQCSYAFETSEGTPLRTRTVTGRPRPHRATPNQLAAFEAILRPLNFSGPANIDYKLDPRGAVQVFEVNPRLGGSLFRPANRGDLEEALRAIVTHARWRPRPR